ncbi:MAG: hypothetical protein EA353_05395, partial [Puniceicoccaceae bacterium]
DFRIVPEAFSVGDELTNLQKLKRHVVAEKHRELIDSMYDHDTPARTRTRNRTRNRKGGRR